MLCHVTWNFCRSQDSCGMSQLYYINSIILTIVLTVPKRELLVVLPFLGRFSLNLRKHLDKSVNKSLPHCNIEVIFQSKNRLNNLFKFKDSIPLYLRSHLIYKFQCSNCNITYYGETEHHLKVRAGEHISTSPLTGKKGP